LDRGFVPALRWRQAYRRMASADRQSVPVTIAVARPGGGASHFRALIAPHEELHAASNLRFLERTVKFLLWSRGGSRVFIAGAPEAAAEIAAAYAPGGARAFDAEFLGRKIYLEEFSVQSCDESALPPDTDRAGAGGGGLQGCRIGFDLGGSDRKTAALIDGKVVFSEEIPWDPYFQRDPAYHEEGIRDSLRRAAAHLPRVDAIGGSAAGVYVDNEPRVGSLFRGVPDELFAGRIRPIFKRIAAEWNVPLEVANDGDVTALAAARMIGGGASGGVLGLSLGTSLAGGYVAPGGGLMPWLNELAFVPVDYRGPGAHVDEWSGDAGTGARYHSQQALAQLLDGPEIPASLPLPEKLAALQEAAARGEAWTVPVYESLGVYLGYSLAHFAEFYQFEHVLILGRVTSGPGGDAMLDTARVVLRDEAPGLLEKISFLAADEKFKRHGQAMAAASLPRLDKK
jgi:predicted NBD/HSP70 family sugar kinase